MKQLIEKALKVEAGNKASVKQLIEEALKVETKNYISTTMEDLDTMEITYDNAKKEFEEVRERNEIETHREYF